MAHIDDPVTRKSDLNFVKATMREPMLDRTDEFHLAGEWREKGDTFSLDALVRPHMRLVVSLARRFRNYGLPMADLIQEGNVGLMQAAARFEPSREVRFSTYATWWIKAGMQDYILRNWSIVRLGTTATQKTLFFNLRRLREQIEKSDGVLSDAGRQRIADQLRVPLGELKSMETMLAGSDQSLNAPVGDEGGDNWQDFLADSGPSPEEVVIELRDARTRSQWLAEAIGDLPAREQTIIRRRRLMDEPVTLERLGVEFGVSKERVRQLELRALTKLRMSLLRKEGNRAEGVGG
jgi:RNA polymerase sigma-32 factor